MTQLKTEMPTAFTLLIDQPAPMNLWSRIKFLCGAQPVVKATVKVDVIKQKMVVITKTVCGFNEK